VSATVRRVVVAVLLVLATLLWSAGIVGVWAQRQLLDTDNWVQTSDRLLENGQIRETLSDALLQRLYAGRPVEAKLEETLPAPLNKLAAPISAGLRQIADNNAPKVLGSAAVLSAWETSNRTAHKALVAILEGKAAANGEVNLDLQNILTQVANGTGLPAGIVDRLPPEQRQLVILQSDQLKAAQDAVQNVKKLVVVLVIVAILLYAIAIAVSPDRRRGAVGVAASLLFAGLAILALRRIGDHTVVETLARSADVRPAIEAAFFIGTSLLVDVAQGTILLGFLLLVGAWLAGPGKRATALRRVSAPALRDRPGTVRVVLGLLLLLLIIWGPVPWTQKLVPVLILIVAAFIWLEWVRRRTLEEFGDIEPGELGRTLRAARPGRGDQARAG
jgi:hypothetical protein